MITIFHDEVNERAHDHFQDWRRENENGFFINCNGKTRWMIHRVTCMHPGNTKWTRALGKSLTKSRKVCSNAYQELREWGRTHCSDAELVRCSHCLPGESATEQLLNDGDDAAPGSLTVADFTSALKSLALRKHDLEMLQTHYHAPDRTITATQMARAIGFASFEAVNLHYGTLASRIAEKIGLAPATSSSILVVFTWPDGECHWTMRPQLAEALRNLEWVTDSRSGSTDEEFGSEHVLEGALFRISVNVYERSPVASKRCIDHYGAICFVCGFDFSRVYGEVVAGLIHVHHLRALSEIGQEYKVDPIKDLRPVCPNCHAVLHSRNPAYSIEEVRGFLSWQKEKAKATPS